MQVFYFEFLLIIILWFLSKMVFKSKKIDLFFRITIISTLIIIGGLRSESTGADTAGYLRWFTIISDIKWTDLRKFTSLEYGYVVLNKFISCFSNDGRFFLICMSFITILPLCIFIELKSDNKYFSYLLLLGFTYWSSAMITLRQYTALSVCIFSLIFVERKGFLSFILYVLCMYIAYLFHKTAVFFIPIYFIKYIKVNGILFFVTFVFIFIFIIFGSKIVGFLNSFARIHYEVKKTGGLHFLILLCLIAMCSYTLCSQYIKKDQSLSFYFAMILYSIMIQTLAINMELLVRATRYPLIAILVFIPNLFDKYFSKRDNKIYVPIFNTFVCIFLFYLMYISLDISSFPSGYSFIM